MGRHVFALHVCLYELARVWLGRASLRVGFASRGGSALSVIVSACSRGTENVDLGYHFPAFCKPASNVCLLSCRVEGRQKTGHAALPENPPNKHNNKIKITSKNKNKHKYKNKNQNKNTNKDNNKNQIKKNKSKNNNTNTNTIINNNTNTREHTNTINSTATNKNKKR